MVLASRFATGAPLGQRRTDATFLSRGTRPVGGVPGWFTTGQPGRWAYLPGWQRAAVRWAAVAAAIGLLRPAADHRRRARRPGRRRPGRRWPPAGGGRGTCAPWSAPSTCSCAATSAPTRPPARPVAGRPARLRRRPRTRVVTLTYPAAWNPDAAKQKNIDEVIRRHLGGDLAGTFGRAPATWRHPPAPPARALFDGYDLPAHRIHLATLAGGRKWIADLENEEPHLFIAAGTGGGKTATAVRRRRARPRARLADRHHRPQAPLLHRPQNRRRTCSTNVPGIRVHTDIESMMWALEEFFLSMLGVNIAVGAHAAWPGAFPQRMLVIDEFGTFAGMAARIHHRTGGTGPLPALDQRRQIEWQGRVGRAPAAGRGAPAEPAVVRRLRQPRQLRLPAHHRRLHRLAVADDVRVRAADRMGRPDQGPGRGRHRGSPALIHHAQIAWLPAAERRRYALTGPPPPDWFTDMQPAPWITAARAGRRPQARRRLPRPPPRRRDVPADVPPATATPGTSAKTPRCPARCPAPGHPRPLPAPPDRPGSAAPRPGPVGDGQPVTSTGTGGRHRAATPGPTATRPPANELIVGIADAASYLGYDKPDSFRRARTRNPIPGERKTARRAALLDPGRAAELAEQTQDRRQPHPRRGARLAGCRSDHRQPGQQDVQVSLFHLLTVRAVLGGEPQRPPLVPEKRPLVAQLADPVLLAGREVHDLSPPELALPGPFGQLRLDGAQMRQDRPAHRRSPAGPGPGWRAGSRLACSSSLAVSLITSCGRIRVRHEPASCGRPARQPRRQAGLAAGHEPEAREPADRRIRWLVPAHGGSRGVHRWSAREADASAGLRSRARSSSGWS